MDTKEIIERFESNPSFVDECMDKYEDEDSSESPYQNHRTRLLFQGYKERALEDESGADRLWFKVGFAECVCGLDSRPGMPSSYYDGYSSRYEIEQNF